MNKTNLEMITNILNAWYDISEKNVKVAKDIADLVQDGCDHRYYEKLFGTHYNVRICNICGDTKRE